MKAGAHAKSTSSTGTKRPRSREDEESAIRNVSFDVPSGSHSTSNSFTDFAFANDQDFLMGSPDLIGNSPASKHFTFNYPSPISNEFPVGICNFGFELDS